MICDYLTSFLLLTGDLQSTVRYSLYRTCEECSSPRSLRSLGSERLINIRVGSTIHSIVNIRVGIPVSKRQIDKSNNNALPAGHTLTITRITILPFLLFPICSPIYLIYSYRSIHTLLDLSYLRTTPSLPHLKHVRVYNVDDGIARCFRGDNSQIVRVCNEVKCRNELNYI